MALDGGLDLAHVPSEGIEAGQDGLLEGLAGGVATCGTKQLGWVGLQGDTYPLDDLVSRWALGAQLNPGKVGGRHRNTLGQLVERQAALAAQLAYQCSESQGTVGLSVASRTGHARRLRAEVSGSLPVPVRSDMALYNGRRGSGSLLIPETRRPPTMPTLLFRRQGRGSFAALVALVACVLALPSAAGALSFKRVQGLPRSCESSSGVQASDGSLWTTCSQETKSGGGLMRVSPSGKVSGPFRPPVEPHNTNRIGKPTWNIADMVAGRAGSLWFTSGYGLVCNLSATGHMDCARTPSSLKSPTETYTSAIAEGSEGNAWMLEEVRAKDGVTTDALIVRITPTLQMTEFPLPNEWGMLPGLVLGSNGDLWFGRSEKHPGFEGVAYMTPSGEVTSFPLVPEAVTTAYPELALPSGAIYYVAGNDDEHIDKVMPNGSQSVIVSLHTILSIIPGAEESAWALGQSLKAGAGYHYYKPGIIDHISVSGAVSSFPLSGRFVIEDLQLGPEGELWGLTHGYTEKVFRFISIGPSGKIVTRDSWGVHSATFPAGLVASSTSLWLFTSDPYRGIHDGTELERVTTSPESIAATANAKPPYCEYPNNYYPGLCGVPKQQATDTCAELTANDNNPHSSGLRARYIKASSQFSFAFTENPMGGCGKYAGSRQVSYYEELRSGLTGAFARVGPATTVIANEYDRVRRTIPVSLQCSSSLSGSAVREVVKVSWIPKRGWGKTPTNYPAPLSALPLVWNYATKAQIVC